MGFLCPQEGAFSEISLTTSSNLSRQIGIFFQKKKNLKGVFYLTKCQKNRRQTGKIHMLM